MGYTYDFAIWEESIYRFLFITNTLPYAWGNRQWAAALPHWTINEFFTELEKLLLFEFDIDHKRAMVTCSLTADNVANAGTTMIDKVLDNFTIEVDTEDNNAYKAMQNQGYAAGGHRMDNFYNCRWYIKQMTREDGTVRCTTYETLQDLLNSTPTLWFFTRIFVNYRKFLPLR